MGRNKKYLSMYNIIGVGIGGIIGGGYFLGSGLSIHETGPSVILSFLTGGIIMMQVLGAVTSINVNRLMQGSFRTYAEEFLGPYTGFLIGWMIFATSILTIASEAVATGVFARYWFHNISLPILAVIITIFVAIMNAFGSKRFSDIESIMSFIKIIMVIVFIIIGGYALLKGFHQQNIFHSVNSFFPKGIKGLLQSMLIVIFSFSGISAVAMASAGVKDPNKTIPKAVLYTTIGVIILYILSMGVIVLITPWKGISTSKSPFIQTLDVLKIYWIASLINLVILISSITVMSATYYTVMEALKSLADVGKAPRYFSSNNKKSYRNIWIVIAICSLVLVGFSFLVPHKIFNYLVSASSYFTFLNWVIILITFLIWLKLRKPNENYISPLIFGKIGAYLTIAMIILLFIMSLGVSDFRMGFYMAFLILVIISISYKLAIHK